MESAVAASLQSDCLPRSCRIVDLRCLGAGELDSLLFEESLEWRAKLDWDFSKVAKLVRRLADGQQLSGAAILDRGEVAGCGYVGLTGDKGVIVDVYVRPNWRSENSEALLFCILFEALIRTPEVRRVESELMLPRAFPEPLFRALPVRSFDRLLMKRDASVLLPPCRASAVRRFQFEAWRECHHDPAAQILSLSYNGNVDSQMCDQYRTVAGARRILNNVVDVQGSDTFCRRASLIAFDMATGLAAGVALASFVADDVGHISELCVVPAARGAGLGYELLRRSAAALAEAGSARISLTVTAGNEDAIRLYSGCGFRVVRRFSAWAWDRPGDSAHALD